jgi:hypothetical protein
LKSATGRSRFANDEVGGAVTVEITGDEHRVDMRSPLLRTRRARRDDRGAENDGEA